VLSGHDAGITFAVEASLQQGSVVGIPLESSPESAASRHIGYRHELYGKLPLHPPANWLPPLSMRHAFIVDELAVWACGEALTTGNYVWNDTIIDECIRTVWQTRIPISVDELVAVFASHGLPTILHDRLAAKFYDGIRLLRWAVGRSAIKKNRLTSFDNLDLRPKEWFDRYILPGLEYE